MLRIGFFTLLALSTLAHPTLAQEPRTPTCADDTKKYCSDIPPIPDRVLMCLVEHKSSLSETCRKALDDRSG